MKNGKLRNAQSSLRDIDSYKPFSSSDSFGSQPLARSWDPEFQEWIEQNNFTEDDLQYLKSAIRRRMLVWFLPCLFLPLIGAFFFVTEWSFYKIVNQRTFQPRLGILFTLLSVEVLLVRLIMWLTPLLIIALLVLPGLMGEEIQWGAIAGLIPLLIIVVFLDLYSKQGKGTAFLSTIKKGFVGLGEDSRILRAAWEMICWPARIVRWIVVGVFAALCFITVKPSTEEFIMVIVAFDLLAIGVCSIVNNIRYRLLLSGYESKRPKKVSAPSRPRPQEENQTPKPPAKPPAKPYKKSHGGVIAAVIAVAALLGAAALILPQTAMPRREGDSQKKDKQTAKEPLVTAAQSLDYTMYEGIYVPAASSGGPRVELQIKGDYLVYDIFWDGEGSGSRADLSGVVPSDGSPEIDLSGSGNTVSGKLYLLESGNIAVESDEDIPYTELVPLLDVLYLEDDNVREPVWDDSLAADASEYCIWPTDTKYITYNDLSPFSRNEIMLMRNELYARYGCSFQNEEIRNYFIKQSWYTPDPDRLAVDFNVEQFSEIERTNLETIINYEKAMGWRE